MIIEILVAIFALVALVNYLLFGSSPINTFHFYFGLLLLIMTLNENKKERK